MEGKNNTIKEGYVYCMCNEIFKFYGDDVYKLGNTINIKKRLSNYVTSYLNPSKIIILSKKLADKYLGEQMLFDFLKEYRIKENKEFFKCKIEKIREMIHKVEKIMDTENLEELRNKYINSKINIKLCKNDLIKKIENNKMNIKLCKNDLIKKIENKKMNTFVKDVNIISLSKTCESVCNVPEDIALISENEIVNNNENYKLDKKINDKINKLRNSLKIELNADIINEWSDKTDKLDNLLYALEKNSYDDPKIKNKIEYLNKILDTFGFEDPLDFETVITSTDDLFKKFENSGIMEKNYYINMMKSFGKQIRCRNFDFEMNKYILICNSVLSEFCIHISSKRRKTKGIYYYEYRLIQNLLYLKDIINKY